MYIFNGNPPCSRTGGDKSFPVLFQIETSESGQQYTTYEKSILEIFADNQGRFEFRSPLDGGTPTGDGVPIRISIPHLNYSHVIPITFYLERLNVFQKNCRQ